ncbi:MAG: peptidase M50 [Rhodocyclaceae bacterium]|nr:peptidase M50 [Rhodocyclaceae bacterium]
MNAPRAAAGWHRVAGLRPRLRAHGQVRRHSYRGEPWYVLEDAASGRHHRFTPAAHALVSRMDGGRTVQEIFDAVGAELGDEAPGQEEVIALLASLHRADLLQTDAAPDLGELAARRGLFRRLRLRQYLGNPLSVKLPLWDPDPFLSALVPRLRPLLSPWGAALWLLVVATGATLAAMRWQALTHGLADRVLALENLLLIALVYPAVKFLHELGHGIAVKRQGGQVREMGLMFLVLVPVPYVDASAAAAVRSRGARMGIGLAGVAAEFLLAALAMIVWDLAEAGAVRAVCFNVMLIGGVSAVLFNLNPLLRYDAYYVLSDFLEIPNLGQRANAYLGHLANRLVLRRRDLPPPAGTGAERFWLAAYAVGAFLYRIAVAVGIVLFIAGQYFFVGVLLAVWAAINMLVLPVGKALARILGRGQPAPARRRAALVLGVGAAVLLAVAFLVPVPQWTRTEGIVWAPEQARVRSANDCFVSAVLVRRDQWVRTGDPLVQCEDPELVAKARELEGRLEELAAGRIAYFASNRMHADMVREEMEHAEARLREIRQRVDGLMLRSPADGRFVMADPESAPGRHVGRGDTLAYVLDASPVRVRVVVHQAQVDLVRSAVRAVEVLPSDRLFEPSAARVLREIPAATDELPSAALAVESGGSVGTDPRRRRDRQEDRPAGTGGEARALQTLFLFDLELPPGVPAAGIGQRMHVRFEHPWTPVAVQAYRALRRLFLARFNV